MANNFNHINNGIPSINQMAQQIGKPGRQQINQAAGSSFEQLLRERVDSGSIELKFSKHANERLQSRNIDLSDEQLERLETGVNKAQTKGINESLVMVDDVAFIVNIRNSTVITAVSDMEEQIFTNIDGAVIA